MCHPIQPPRLDLKALSLDDLGLLARHKKATPAVREAFARELLRWTRQRVQSMSGRRLQLADVADVAQEFAIRCFTRHVEQWNPALVSLSAFLYRRLRCEVIDRQRLLRRRQERDFDVDGLELPTQLPNVDEIQTTREEEARLRHLDVVVGRLPRRQRMVMRRTLRGEQLKDIAKDARVHHSTLSRERTQAIRHIHAALAA
ncbi:MAG: sigma-70 family RNA polymerase sigma factor [Deltaproteobacteria bacterium]|nr:sigma-70 family RNA polymerase sigma factor [Deltaproteobacteria bacterium]